MTAAAKPAVAEGGGVLQCATFYLGDALWGVPIDQIDEINRYVEFTPVPHAPAWVRGVINLRGDVVTVIDLRSVLGLEPIEVAASTRNVIVSSAGEHIGLLVDRIADVVSARSDQVTAPPANVGATDGRFLRGVYPMEHDLLLILDVETVLAGGTAA